MEQPTDPERLQKIIARSGLTSRRGAEEMILGGRVQVDGETAVIGQRVDPGVQKVTVDRIMLPVAPDLAYYLLNKPTGVVSTIADTHGRTTVVELIPATARVFPVGRLDAETTGVLILTNDGELTNLVTHPSHGVPKTYQALVEGEAGDRVLRRLRRGVELDDGMAAAASARRIGLERGRTHIEIVMHEGRKRIVRRMLDSVGHPVVELHRSAVGPVKDSGLAVGAWRHLDMVEVRGLYAAGGAS